MSAPHEIIVHNGRAFSDLNTHGMTDGFINTVQKVGVRYLRADLTCGECAIGINAGDGCSHYYHEDACPEMGSRACGDFVPRKRTP